MFYHTMYHINIWVQSGYMATVSRPYSTDGKKLLLRGGAELFPPLEYHHQQVL